LKRAQVVSILFLIIFAVSHPQERASDIDQGQNLEAAGLSLSSNYNAVDAINVIGGIKNSGFVPQTNVVARFFQGEPGGGRIQIGEDVIIPDIPPGITVFDSVIWQGSTGARYFFLIVDPDSSSLEED